MELLNRPIAVFTIAMAFCGCRTAAVAPVAGFADAKSTEVQANDAQDSDLQGLEALAADGDAQAPQDSGPDSDWAARIAACHAQFGYEDVYVYDFAGPQAQTPTLAAYLAAVFTAGCRDLVPPALYTEGIAPCVADKMHEDFVYDEGLSAKAALVTAGKLQYYPAQAANCIKSLMPSGTPELAAACTEVFAGLPGGAPCTNDAECHYPKCDVDDSGCGSCAAVYGANQPTNLPNGATCLSDGQCGSGYCPGLQLADMTPGLCAALPSFGQACVTFQPPCGNHCPPLAYLCAPGGVCDGQVCVAANSVVTGGACMTAAACSAGLVCRFNSVGQGHCYKHGSGISGEPCVTSDDCVPGTFCPDCKNPQGLQSSLHCPQGDQSTCTTRGGQGVACDEQMNGGDCQQGLICSGADWSDEPFDPTATTLCQPLADGLGEPCVHGDQCQLFHASCRGGLCTPEPRMCDRPLVNTANPQGYCDLGFAVDPVSGLCMANPVGGVCHNYANYCGPGLLCLKDQCALPGPVGAFCYGEQDCQVGLQCFKNACAKSMCP